MRPERLMAFTDGVVAIIITIMVLELHAPAVPTLAALGPLAPVFLGYALSFVYVGLYWNNHHHFFNLVSQTSGGILWANLHWLFWLSLIPFATAWHGDHPFASAPAALYGVVLLGAAAAWWLMQRVVIAHQGAESRLKAALGVDWKGLLSPVLYLIGIGLAFVAPLLSDMAYAIVAAIWLIPDRRVERAVRAGAPDA